MTLFDDVIRQMRALLPEKPTLSEAYRGELCAESGDKNAILFRRDTAYELGGSGKPGVSSVLFGETGASQDEVLVFGKDLCGLTQDAAFAHLTIVQLKADCEEDLRYEQLKEIGFRLFQLYPKGYHVRISPSAGKEQVRVAKDALRITKPLSFVNVGCSLIRLLRECPDVARVQTVFITEESVDYTALGALSRRAKSITEAVQHTMQPGALDCASCKMKPLCDEIDGLKELHFKKGGKT
ncbi:MAG: hypothetical protein IJU96_11175 [Clostridia bacterium]|nr:hypothetical protein [Clostridia bacterium]MBQ9553303.1 hypothetical protein [Clostridia bacterium]